MTGISDAGLNRNAQIAVDGPVIVTSDLPEKYDTPS